MKTKYKYIHFEEDQIKPFNGKPLYNCKNNKSGSTLAIIFYYKPWKQYCFTQAEQNMVFNYDCLLDIADFIKQLNAGLRRDEE